MADLIIKPSSGNSLVLQDEGGDAALTVNASGNVQAATTLGVTGATTLSGATTCSTTLGVTGNTTLSGTANDIGTVTNGSLEGTAWRRFNGMFRFTADSCHGETDADWEDTPDEGATSGRTGFLRNPDSCITHADSGQTITINSAGYYFVYATLIPISSTASQSVYIRKNGITQCDNRSGGTVGHGNATGCVVFHLAVNDTVDVKSDTTIHKGHYGNIVIFKIGE